MNFTQKYIQQRDKLLQSTGVEYQSKKIVTAGPVHNVHYLEAGSGDPLLMIHGGGSNASEWINIIEPLSQHFHLYVIDRPGCGLSDNLQYRNIDFKENAALFIQSFMDAAGLKKTSLLGNSMGGYFSICFALKFPERVSKLILIGAPAGMNKWITYLLRALGTRGINYLLTKTVAKPSVHYSRFIHKQLLVANPENISDKYYMLNHYGELLPGGRKSFMSLLENVLTVKGWRKGLYIGDELYKLKMPVRFIWGDKDVFEHPESGKQKALAIKDMQFKIVENAGHCPWLDEPRQCIDLIISMMKD